MKKFAQYSHMVLISYINKKHPLPGVFSVEMSRRDPESELFLNKPFTRFLEN